MEASLIGVAVVGGFLYMRSRDEAGAAFVASGPTASHLKNDVAPGGNKAVLMLADGTIVVLGKAEKGAIANQGAAQVMKLGIGKLAYNILTDDNKVWLNNASSLRYPWLLQGRIGWWS